MIRNILNIHKDIFKEGGEKAKTFSVKKSRVVEELQSTINILANEVLPPLEDLTALIQEKKVTDKELEANFPCKTIVANYKEYKRSPSAFIVSVREILSNLVKKENDIIKCIDKTFKTPVTTDRSITIGEMFVIDLVKAINLVTTFTSDLILTIAFDLRGGTGLNKKFLQKVNGCIVGYVSALSQLDSKKLDDRLNKIPVLNRNKVGEAITLIFEDGIDPDKVEENTDKPAVGMLKSLLETSNLSGMVSLGSLGRAGFIYSPIYHLRMAWADFEISRYESLKNNKQATEAILLDLRLKKEGTNDPSLDKQIQYYENKLTSIQYKIDEYEREFREGK